MGKLQKTLMTRMGQTAMLVAQALVRPAMSTAPVMVPPLVVGPPSADGAQHTVSVSLPLMRCCECYALVDIANNSLHAQWHMDEKQHEGKLVGRLNLILGAVADHEGAILELQEIANRPKVVPRPKKVEPLEQGAMYVNTPQGLKKVAMGGGASVVPNSGVSTAGAQSPKSFIQSMINNGVPRELIEGRFTEAMDAKIDPDTFMGDMPQRSVGLFQQKSADWGHVPPQREEVPTVDGLHYYGQMYGHALYRIPGTPEHLTCMACSSKWPVPPQNAVPNIGARCTA